jgi:hypothetical protein
MAKYDNFERTEEELNLHHCSIPAFARNDRGRTRETSVMMVGDYTKIQTLYL